MNERNRTDDRVRFVFCFRGGDRAGRDDVVLTVIEIGAYIFTLMVLIAGIVSNWRED